MKKYIYKSILVCFISLYMIQACATSTTAPNSSSAPSNSPKISSGKVSRKWRKAFMIALEQALIKVLEKETLHLLEQLPKFLEKWNIEISLNSVNFKSVTDERYSKEWITFYDRACEIVRGKYGDSIFDLYPEIGMYLCRVSLQEKESFVEECLVDDEKLKPFLEEVLFALCSTYSCDVENEIKEQYRAKLDSVESGY